MKGEISVTRWKRFGHHRGYATASDGATLGWIDVPTGTVEIEDGAERATTEAALIAWREQVLAETSAVAPPSQVDDAPPPEVPDWQDLSLHRPGELVRAEALAEWEASKERSKLRAYGARVFNVHTQERAWRVGADGEEVIGTRLEKLVSKGWFVLHSVPVGSRGSDIDHIVIGPGGVFTVNSKNHPGAKIWVAKYQMRVNGQPVDYLRNARHEGQRASKLLTAATGFPVEVRSCVVVLTNTLVPNVNYKQMPKDVMVLDRMDIPGWFKRRKRVLTDAEIEEIYNIARRSTTWTTRR